MAMLLIGESKQCEMIQVDKQLISNGILQIRFQYL